MSILSFLVSLFHKIFGRLTPEQKAIVKVASDVINAIKSGQDYDTAIEGVLTVIPEELREQFMSNIVRVLFEADLIDSPNYTIREAIVHAGEKAKELKGLLLHKVKLNNLGIFLIDVFADGNIGWDDLAHLPKLFFDHKDDK